MWIIPTQVRRIHVVSNAFQWNIAFKGHDIIIFFQQVHKCRLDFGISSANIFALRDLTSLTSALIIVVLHRELLSPCFFPTFSPSSPHFLQVGSNREEVGEKSGVYQSLKPLILLHFFNPPDFSQDLVSRFPYIT